MEESFNMEKYIAEVSFKKDSPSIHYYKGIISVPNIVEDEETIDIEVTVEVAHEDEDFNNDAHYIRDVIIGPAYIDLLLTRTVVGKDTELRKFESTRDFKEQVKAEFNKYLEEKLS